MKHIQIDIFDQMNNHAQKIHLNLFTPMGLERDWDVSLYFFRSEDAHLFDRKYSSEYVPIKLFIPFH